MGSVYTMKDLENPTYVMKKTVVVQGKATYKDYNNYLQNYSEKNKDSVDGDVSNNKKEIFKESKTETYDNLSNANESSITSNVAQNSSNNVIKSRIQSFSQNNSVNDTKPKVDSIKFTTKTDNAIKNDGKKVTNYKEYLENYHTKKFSPVKTNILEKSNGQFENGQNISKVIINKNTKTDSVEVESNTSSKPPGKKNVVKSEIVIQVSDPTTHEQNLRINGHTQLKKTFDLNNKKYPSISPKSPELCEKIASQNFKENRQKLINQIDKNKFALAQEPHNLNSFNFALSPRPIHSPNPPTSPVSSHSPISSHSPTPSQSPLPSFSPQNLLSSQSSISSHSLISPQSSISSQSSVLSSSSNSPVPSHSPLLTSLPIQVSSLPKQNLTSQDLNETNLNLNGGYPVNGSNTTENHATIGINSCPPPPPPPPMMPTNGYKPIYSKSSSSVSSLSSSENTGPRQPVITDRISAKDSVIEELKRRSLRKYKPEQEPQINRSIPISVTDGNSGISVLSKIVEKDRVTQVSGSKDNNIKEKNIAYNQNEVKIQKVPNFQEILEKSKNCENVPRNGIAGNQEKKTQPKNSPKFTAIAKVFENNGASAEKTPDRPKYLNGKVENVNGITNRVSNTEANVKTVVPVADINEELTKDDPNVKKLVYNTYRGLLGAYNNKANEMISTLPRNAVEQNVGVTKQVENLR